LVVLVSNDDGARSEGLTALLNYLQPLGEVIAVVPDRERSAAAHSLTLHRPLRVEEVSRNFFVVDGTPTDCITLAVNALLQVRPDLVVSGINKGANLGTDITYSGTVSAAVEGTLLKIPSFAVSLVNGEPYHFDTAGEFAFKLAKLILDEGLPRDTLLNINVPNLPWQQVQGVKITRQGRRRFKDVIVEKTDPRGKKYFWIGGDELGFLRVPGTDHQALAENFISITPLQLDLTNYSCLEEFEAWKLWP